MSQLCDNHNSSEADDTTMMDGIEVAEHRSSDVPSDVETEETVTLADTTTAEVDTNGLLLCEHQSTGAQISVGICSGCLSHGVALMSCTRCSAPLCAECVALPDIDWLTEGLESSNEPSDFVDDDSEATLTFEDTKEKEDSGCTPDPYDNETKEMFKERLMTWLQQMMFVSGETAEPSAETTWMIEEIVREQVVEMLLHATQLANRRGSRSIAVADLIFQIRHNTAKVSRLKTFLSWKDVRKNVKDSEDRGGGDADAADFEETSGVPGTNPTAPQKTSSNKKAKLVLPWEIQSFYSETVPEREDEEDEEEEEQNEATIARLAQADERTKNMTKDEYVYWSDCRQASFTFRKSKRFREWAGFGTVIDSKPNDDIIDILGFLTFEIVQTITEEALKVKMMEEVAKKKGGVGAREDKEKKRKREGCSLFEMPEEGKTPVDVKHVQEAFRRLQVVPKKYTFMRQGFAGLRTPLRLI